MKKNQKKRLIGKVFSDKMKNTLVIEVERIKFDAKLKTRYKRHKKYKAHTDNNDYKVGDSVIIEECRPISKDKRWRVISKRQ